MSEFWGGADVPRSPKAVAGTARDKRRVLGSSGLGRTTLALVCRVSLFSPALLVHPL